MIPTLAQILSTVATVTIDGVVIRPETALTIKPMRSTFDVRTCTVGVLQKRVQETAVELSFKPDGRFTSGIAAALHPYASLDIGRTTGAVMFIAQATGLNVSTDVLTYAGHGLATGEAVAIGYTGTAPTVTGGFPRGTLVYARSLTSSTFSLHASEAGAVANTGKVDFTVLGTGWITVARMRKVVVHSTMGVKLTFHHCCVTTLPNLRFGATVSLWESVTFRAYHKMGALPAANTLFTVEEAAFTDTAIDEDEFLFGTPVITTGFAGAFADLADGSVVEVDFSMQATDIPCDAQGVMGQKLGGISATVKVTSPGLTWQETLEALGMTAGRGAAVTEGDLTVGNGVIVFAMRAILQPPDLVAQADADMTGPLTFELVRAHTDGIPAAWYSLTLD